MCTMLPLSFVLSSALAPLEKDVASQNCGDAVDRTSSAKMCDTITQNVYNVSVTLPGLAYAELYWCK